MLRAEPRDVAPHVPAALGPDVEGRVADAKLLVEERAQQEGVPADLDPGGGAGRLDPLGPHVGVGAGELEPEVERLGHGAKLAPARGKRSRPCGLDFPGDRLYKPPPLSAARAGSSAV